MCEYKEPLLPTGPSTQVLPSPSPSHPALTFTPSSPSLPALTFLLSVISCSNIAPKTGERHAKITLCALNCFSPTLSVTSLKEPLRNTSPMSLCNVDSGTCEGEGRGRGESGHGDNSLCLTSVRSEVHTPLQPYSEQALSTPDGPASADGQCSVCTVHVLSISRDESPANIHTDRHTDRHSCCWYLWSG